MKHRGEQIGTEAVANALATAGMTLTEPQVSRLAGHAALVLEANDRLNLTRIVDSDDVLQLHIVDSVAFLPLIDPIREPILDLGSGAGFPGIPLAILGHSVTLCESVKKKAAFLEEAVAQLGVDARVVALRAEELAVREAGTYGSVVARAVSSLSALLELASPLLRLGGTLIALKGSPELEEVEAALRVAAITGFELRRDQRYQLPRGEQRRVFVYEKTRAASVALPRRPGMAQRQPLSGT